jgi:hypothetical protein
VEEVVTVQWDQHFRGVSKASRARAKLSRDNPPAAPSFGGESRPVFGTMLGGNHTAHELDDLLRAKQSEIDDVTHHIGALPPSSDPAWKQWAADWRQFLSDWESARATAQRFVDAARDNPNLTRVDAFLESPLALFTQSDPLDMLDAEAPYQDVLRVLMPSGIGTSRLQDLYRRYTQLPNATPVKFRPVPQPKAPDEELQVYNRLPDLSHPKHPWPWWYWAAGGTVVAAAGVFVLKSTPIGAALKLAGILR